MAEDVFRPIEPVRGNYPLEDGIVYSSRKELYPFSVSALEDYIPLVGEEKIEKVQRLAQKLKGMKVLEVNSCARGGGVAEMLRSQVPFMNQLGIEDEWKVICGKESFFQVTKEIHNLLQGKKGTITPHMLRIYQRTLIEVAQFHSEEHNKYSPDVEIVHDPQPFGLSRYLKKDKEKWLWRCHIDIAEETLEANPVLWQFFSSWVDFYNAAMFSGAHYVIHRWPLPKFISPPFIDPLSTKNRDLGFDEIAPVLEKYQIDSSIPLLVHIGRFDPWKGIDTSIKAYKLAREEVKCQLIIAGNMASDDPEGKGIFDKICEDTKDDPNLHVIILADDTEVNALEVNALQRAARVILQPSTKEGFGLVITEAMWKKKPVITREVGSIPLQIRSGETGFFISSAKKAARRIVHLLNNPREAEIAGDKAHQYVREHFLMPDRIADYLRVFNQMVNDELDEDSIISYHPWYKLRKRRA
jgi:trehalose synthase